MRSLGSFAGDILALENAQPNCRRRRNNNEDAKQAGNVYHLLVLCNSPVRLPNELFCDVAQ